MARRARARRGLRGLPEQHAEDFRNAFRALNLAVVAAEDAHDCPERYSLALDAMEQLGMARVSLRYSGAAYAGKDHPEDRVAFAEKYLGRQADRIYDAMLAPCWRGSQDDAGVTPMTPLAGARRRSRR